MKKVLLINSNTETAPYPVSPLGLCLVARSIEKNFEVAIFNPAEHNNQLTNLSLQLKAFKPDYIGISIRNIDNVVMGRPVFYLPNIFSNIIQAVRTYCSQLPTPNSQLPIILGGSGFSIFPEKILAETGIEYGIVGEGEASFPLLLDALENGKEPDGIPGVIYKKSTNLILDTRYPIPETNHSYYQFTPPVFSLKMTDVPSSKLYELINFDAYKLRGSYPIQTKRGCIYSCIYCTYPNLEGRTYRLRKPCEIADEIEDAYEMLGDVLFEFVDSTFNSPSGHAEAICEEIIKRKLKVRLRTMGINPLETSDKLLSLMKEAGFSQIDCTPDTASARMLKRMRKNFSLEQLQACANLIKKHDMPTMWFFMFGGPGENKESVMETFSFIDEYVSKDDMALIGEGIRILPNTELYDIAIEQGLIKENDSLLAPVFYVSPDIDKQLLSEILLEEIAKRDNVVHSLDSTPKQEMLAEAIAMRIKDNLTEPMFRTLLRLKKKYT